MHSTDLVAPAGWRQIAIRCAAAIYVVAALGGPAAAVEDVLLQTVDGQIVTGIVEDTTFEGSLGTRVHRGQFLSNLRSANPGFAALPTGSPSLPPDVQGFPSNHDVNFDLVPMTIDCVVSNLFYWDGSDLGEEGLDFSDVKFVVPEETTWEVFDANFDQFAADGSDQLIPGGLIARTSADIDPFDGVDRGMIHKHLVLQLSGAGSSAPSAEGVYLITWQARSAGFATSEPFFFVHRTSTILDAVRDLAADWVEANLEMLTSPTELDGDYNCDGSVDAADYVAWRATLGQTGSGLAADGNRNGEVDEVDYTIWRANFGRTSSAHATRSAAAPNALPEPSAALLLSGTFAGVFLWATQRNVHCLRLSSCHS